MFFLHSLFSPVLACGVRFFVPCVLSKRDVLFHCILCVTPQHLNTCKHTRTLVVARSSFFCAEVNMAFEPDSLNDKDDQ